jgi:hypothetical protein
VRPDPAHQTLEQRLPEHQRLGHHAERGKRLRILRHGHQRLRILRKSREVGIGSERPERRIIDHQFKRIGLHQTRNGLITRRNVGFGNLIVAVTLDRHDGASGQPVNRRTTLCDEINTNGNYCHCAHGP